MKSLFEKLYFVFLHVFNFPALNSRKPTLVCKMFLMFQHNFAYMINSFVIPEDITVMIKILQEFNHTLFEKMLKATNLY